MSITVDIDSNSGFCAGVIRAIGKAEEFLDNRKDKETRLFSLGSIVHNDAELKRLEAKGLVCIDRDDLDDMMDAGNETLLIEGKGTWIQCHRLYMSSGPASAEGYT